MYNTCPTLVGGNETLFGAVSLRWYFIIVRPGKIGVEISVVVDNLNSRSLKISHVQQWYPNVDTMFRIHYFTNTVSRAVVVKRHSARFISFLKMKETFRRLLGMNSNELPYTHICQVGDPVLRGRAMKIEPEVVRMADFQKVIKHLISVMRAYDIYGLSGPQIGLPWQIFAIECTKENTKGIEESVKKAHEMNIVPMTIFINPELKIIDHTSITLYEGCESIRGFSAAVPRAYEVEITALNASAEQFTWRARGWSARIAQHEYDHLQGRLYIEKMDARTFHCTAWHKINQNKGKMRLSYWPRN